MKVIIMSVATILSPSSRTQTHRYFSLSDGHSGRIVRTRLTLMRAKSSNMKKESACRLAPSARNR